MSGTQRPLRRRDAVLAPLRRFKTVLSSHPPVHVSQATTNQTASATNLGSPNDRIHKEAFDSFRSSHPKDAELLATHLNPQTSTEWHADTVEFMTEQLAKAKESRLKVRLRDGKVLIVGDALGKITNWIGMMVAVGDNAVQFDPAHAALPWAAFRFVLQSALNYGEAGSAVWEGIESICNELVWVNLQEALYLGSVTPASLQVRKALIAFYQELFTVLAKYINHLNRSRGTRLLLSPFVSKASFQQYLSDTDRAKKAIESLSEQVTREAQLTQNARIKQVLEKLANLNAPILRLQVTNDRMYDILEEKAHEELLEWVSDVQQATQFSRAFAKALAGTGQWLFESDIYKKWKTSSTAEILRMHGKAGSGKSTLFSILLHRLRKETKTEGLAPPVYFYCARTSEEKKRSQPLQILRCLLKQLSQSPRNRGLQQDVLERYKRRREEGELREDEIIALALKCIESRGPTHILVDALDESDPRSREVLLGGLVRLIRDSSSLVKIFLTSRDQRYEGMILDYPELKIRPKDNTPDILLYISSELDRMEQQKTLLVGRVSSDLRSHISLQLAEKADGMFRWVDLQLQRLKHFCDESLIREHLGKPPLDLIESYQSLFDIEIDHLDRFLPGTKEIALRTFKLLMVVREQLPTEEICQLVGHIDEHDAPKPIDHLIQYCFSLVEHDQDGKTLRFCHLSVREFFESENHKSANPDFEETEIHASIAATCLSLVSNAVRGKARLCDYAVRAWRDHAQHAGQKRIDGSLGTDLRKFLHDKEVFYGWTFMFTRRDAVHLTQQLLDSADEVHPLMVIVDRNFYELIPEFSTEMSADMLAEVGYQVETGTLSFMGHADMGLLGLAVFNGHLEALEALFDLGMTIQSDRRFGDALEEASRRGHTKVVQFLLEQGERSEKDHLGNALVAAVRWSRLSGDKLDVIELLLDAGADVNYRTATGGRSALMEAIWPSNNIAIISLLLERGARPDIKDEYGNDALLEACESFVPSERVNVDDRVDVKIVQMLLDKGADVDTSWTDGQSALMIAIANSKLGVVQLLLDTSTALQREEIQSLLGTAVRTGKKCCKLVGILSSKLTNVKLKFQADDLAEGLIQATKSGLIEDVKFLVRHGAVEKNPTKPFMATACSCGQGDIARYLIEEGVSIDSPYGYDKITALTLATQRGDLDLMRLLLKQGANVNGNHQKHYADGMDSYASYKSVFPLQAASIRGHLLAVEMLLKYGAKVDYCDWGDNPLTAAARHNRLEVMKLLLAWKANVNIVGHSSGSALMAAAECGQNVSAVELLLLNGASVKIAAKQRGRTALHAAIKGGNAQIVKLLLENDAAVNVEADDVGFPLHLAVRKGDAEIVKLLLEKGVEVNVETKKLGLPLHLAVQGGDAETVKLLLEHDAEVNIGANAIGLPFHLAVHEHAGRFLPKHSAKINVVPIAIGLPLHLAVWRGDSKIAELLLDHDAEIDAKQPCSIRRKGFPYVPRRKPYRSQVSVSTTPRKYGVGVRLAPGEENETPLCIAALQGRAEIVKLLISRGADVNARGENDQTVLMLCIKSVDLRRLTYKSEAITIISLLCRNKADTMKSAQGLNALDRASQVLEKVKKKAEIEKAGGRQVKLDKLKDHCTAVVKVLESLRARRSEGYLAFQEHERWRRRRTGIDVDGVAEFFNMLSS